MTSATLLTPRGTGAIAVILLSGPDAPAAVAALSGPIPADVGGIRRARFASAEGPIDDGLVVRTGNNRFELHLHGGVAVVDAILAGLRGAGVEILATPPDPPTLETELALALPRALTETGVRLLANQTTTGLAAWIEKWLARLASPTAGLTEFDSEAQWLLTRARTLERLLTPARVAIVGPPNAGKSTLANALLGRPVSITSNIPGTTRDWVDATATLVVGDVAVPVTLVDTAGVRDTADAIEIESIRRTHAQLAAADAAVIVLDATAPLDAATQSLLTTLALPTIAAVNKSDLPSPRFQISDLRLHHSIPISALTGSNLAALAATVLAQLDLADISLAEPFPFTPRQQGLLEFASLAPTPAVAARALAQILAS